jgi:hypothetical protein
MPVPRSRKWNNKQNELEVALLNEESEIMSTPITDDMDLIQRAWLGNKKKIIHDRDV